MERGGHLEAGGAVEGGAALLHLAHLVGEPPLVPCGRWVQAMPPGRMSDRAGSAGGSAAVLHAVQHSSLVPHAVQHPSLVPHAQSAAAGVSREDAAPCYVSLIPPLMCASRIM
jgi:hypothetical protein